MRREPVQHARPGHRGWRAGWGSMDVVLAIAISATLVASTLHLYQRSVEGLRQQRLAAQINAIADGVRDLGAAAGGGYGPAGDITQRLFDLGIGNPDSRGTGGYRTPYGDSYRIVAEGTRFRISTLLPVAACALTHLQLPGLYAVSLPEQSSPLVLRPPWPPDAAAAIAAACRAPSTLVSYLFQ